MESERKVLLVGWDAADWKVISRLMDDGRMPTVQRLVEHGIKGDMATLSPVLSPMLWTSIATGKRPFKHGIYGFSEPTPDRTGVQPMTNVSRKCKAIWNILNQNGKKPIVVGWWPSHPAEPVDGVMVSDFYCKVPRKPGQPWKLMKKAVHPETLYDELNDLRVHPEHLKAEDILPFLPHGAEIDQEMDRRVSSLLTILCECTSVQSAATHLLSTQPWDFAAVYFDAIDHFSHAFMKYHPPRQSHISEADFRMYKDVVSVGYIYHDMMLARLLEIAGEDVTVILMSDHGFHPDHLRPKQMPSEPAGPAVEHRDYGILVVSGPGIKQDELVYGANLLDVTPTILSLYGLPIGEDMDGKVLVEIFQEKPEIRTVPSWDSIEGKDGQHPKNLKLDPVESREAMEQLIALGYIERPDPDSEKATSNCVRELDYNLARSYMDAGMHGLAVPILVNLYRNHPLEFRFGIQLANCLKVMDRNQDLETVVNDLNLRWRQASVEAKKRLRSLSELRKERELNWAELKKIDDENRKQSSSPPPRVARMNPNGTPKLFSEQENHAIRQLRAIGRGNAATLDYLSATVALSKGEFETALGYLEKTKKVMSKSPGFQYQSGNVLFALGRSEEAEAAFLRALELDASHSSSMMGLCRIWASTGRLKQALEIGQKAIGLKFHAPLAHFFVGNAKKALGDIAGAIQSYKTALQQNPNFVEAHEMLAEIYSASEIDRELALEHRAAIRQLQDEASAVKEQSEPLTFSPVDPQEFEKLVPHVVAPNNELFLRCLAQPRPMTKIGNQQDSSPPNGRDEILVVSGLPRSGTSMMMQMLMNGGIEVFSDGERTADENNPRGYFESQQVKRLAQVNNWIGESRGKAVKVVSPLIPFLPQDFSYRVILMERDIHEILGSQDKMLDRLNRKGGDLEKQQMGQILQGHQLYAEYLLKLHGIPYARVSYSEAIRNPARVVMELRKFLPVELDENRMVASVDPFLYREKAHSSPQT